jgi:hypothetical protein
VLRARELIEALREAISFSVVLDVCADLRRGGRHSALTPR